MTNKTGKVWGCSSMVVLTPDVEMSHIRVMPSSHCSKHMHQGKNNIFYCLKGMMIIEVWKTSREGHIDETVLMPGDSTEVVAGEYHRFKTPNIQILKEQFPGWSDNDRVEVIELYVRPSLNSKDIVREPGYGGGSLYTFNNSEIKNG